MVEKMDKEIRTLEELRKVVEERGVEYLVNATQVPMPNVELLWDFVLTTYLVGEDILKGIIAMPFIGDKFAIENPWKRAIVKGSGVYVSPSEYGKLIRAFSYKLSEPEKWHTRGRKSRISEITCDEVRIWGYKKEEILNFFGNCEGKKAYVFWISLTAYLYAPLAKDLGIHFKIGRDFTEKVGDMNAREYYPEILPQAIREERGILIEQLNEGENFREWFGDRFIYRSVSKKVEIIEGRYHVEVQELFIWKRGEGDEMIENALRKTATEVKREDLRELQAILFRNFTKALLEESKKV